MIRTSLHSCLVIILFMPMNWVAGQNMILVPAGKFEMGSPESEKERIEDETLHTTRISKSFYLGETEVPYSLWNKVRSWALANGYHDLSVGNNGFKDPVNEDHPVVAVTWWDCIQWCNARSEMEGLSPVYHTSRRFTSENVIRNGMPSVSADAEASGYRLPTESEWEYACRAGTRSAYAMGSKDGEGFDQSGWYRINSARNTHSGGRKSPNPWGLNDMHGNVWEWTDSWYRSYADRDKSFTPTDQSERVQRGGSFLCNSDYCHGYRVSARSHSTPETSLFHVGFRTVKDLP